MTNPESDTFINSNQIIRLKPLVIRLSPLGYHTYASQFFKAAESVGTKDSFSPVPYYLYCHSLELILKAFLLTKNVSQKKLKSKSLGHNLTNVFSAANELGLDSVVKTTEAQEEEIRKANDYYNVPLKGFEYFKVTKAFTGYPSLPDLSILADLISLLIHELEGICLDAA